MILLICDAGYGCCRERKHMTDTPTGETADAAAEENRAKQTGPATTDNA
jgi:hypothetical protein